MSVPAGGTFRYECDVHVKRPGPFDLEIHVYIDDNGVRTVPLSVRGTAVSRP